MKSDYVFIIPVWGGEYIDLLMEYTLFNWCTAGNLDAFVDNKVTFLIVTESSDIYRIQNRRALERIPDYIDVDILVVDGLRDVNSEHHRMSLCYQVGMRHESVELGHTVWVFLTPDCVFSDGSFAYLKKTMESGKNVLSILGLRTNKDGMMNVLGQRELPSYRSQSPNTKHDFIQSCLDNIHPLASAHNWLSTSFLNEWPSNIYFYIGKKPNSIYAHCFHLHPLAIRSSRKMNTYFSSTLDDNFVSDLGYPLETIEVCQSSNLLFCAELSPLSREWPFKLGRPLLGALRHFSIFHASKVHWYYFKRRIHIEGKPIEGINLPSNYVKNNSDIVVADRILLYMNQKSLILMLLGTLYRVFKPLVTAFRSIIKGAMSILRFVIVKMIRIRRG